MLLAIFFLCQHEVKEPGHRVTWLNVYAGINEIMQEMTSFYHSYRFQI